jgi:hypothetical protein
MEKKTKAASLINIPNDLCGCAALGPHNYFAGENAHCFSSEDVIRASDTAFAMGRWSCCFGATAGKSAIPADRHHFGEESCASFSVNVGVRGRCRGREMAGRGVFGWGTEASWFKVKAGSCDTEIIDG